MKSLSLPSSQPYFQANPYDYSSSTYPLKTSKPLCRFQQIESCTYGCFSPHHSDLRFVLKTVFYIYFQKTIIVIIAMHHMMPHTVALPWTPEVFLKPWPLWRCTSNPIQSLSFHGSQPLPRTNIKGDSMQTFCLTVMSWPSGALFCLTGGATGRPKWHSVTRTTSI